MDANNDSTIIFNRQRDGDIFTPIHIFTKEPYREDGPNEILFTLPLPGDNDHLRYEFDDDGHVVFIDPQSTFIEAYAAYAAEHEAKHPNSNDDPVDAAPTADDTATISATTPTTLRVRSKAGAVDDVPDIIPFPSAPAYRNALALRDDITPHMVAVYPNINMTYDSAGRLHIDGHEQTTVSIADIKDNSIDSLDTATLGVLYGIVWTKLKPLLDDFAITVEDSRNYGVVLYVPDLARVMLSDRRQSGYNQADINRIIDKLQSYTHAIGIINDTVGGKVYQSKYPLLQWTGYDARSNTVSFVAPFLNRLAIDVFTAALQQNASGKLQFRADGTPKLLHPHSYLVKSTIASERNKRACEIVRIICLVIEQAGSNAVPHIRAKTIVERVDGFSEALAKSNSKANKNNLLARAFTKAFELLRTQTYISDVYKDIKLPDPRDPAVIPTAGTLDTIVYSFPHNGKRKRTNP